MYSFRSQRRNTAILIFLFILDLACSIALLLNVHGNDWSQSFHSASQFRDFDRDTIDLLLFAFIRILFMPILAHITTRYGTPAYEVASDEYKRITAERDQLRKEWRLKMDYDLLDENLSSGSKDVDLERGRRRKNANQPTSAINGDDKSTPLLSIQERSDAVSSSSTTLPAAESWSGASPVDNNIDSEAAFEATLPPLPVLPALTDSEKWVQSCRAKFIRNCLLALVFILATLCQVYAGVKMVGFDFSNETAQGLLMGTIIVTVNLEQSMLRHIVNTLCKEEGYFFPTLHLHRVYYDETPRPRWCDLCRTRTWKTYSCSKCSFDACRQCFLKKNKSRGEGQLRGEKGAKDEKEIKSSQYMMRALKLARPHWLKILIAFSCLLVTSGASVLAPSYQGKILDDVIRTDQSSFSHDIMFYILLSVGTGFFGGIKSLAFSIVGAHVSNDVRDKLFRAIISQDIVFFDGVSTGELISRLGMDTNAMTSPMRSVLSGTLSNILLLGGGLTMCLITSWRLTVLAMTSIYPIVIITRSYASWSSIVNRGIWASLGDASNVANQAISNIRTVRSFGTEEMEVKKYTESTGEALSKAIKDAWANGGTYALTNYLDLATSVLLLWYGGGVAMGKHSGTLTVGQLITFQLYWGMLNNSYSSLIGVLNDFTRASGAAQRVLSLMDSLPDMDLTIGKKVEHVQGEIEIKDLTFAYQMRPENPVLKGVSLHIKPHTVTALVGRSGGGKSTLVHLLMRFYQPTSGSIYLDGASYDELNFQSVYKHMGVVTQTTELFGGTIKENLVYGLNPDEYTMEDVYEACRAAHAHDFITEFEEGYETRIGDRGVRLSGGQRQRLSVARCMLRKSSLLFLDEATSALDSESEHLVQQALDRLIAQKRCTILLVAHRLSTVMNADQICVLDGGVIKERGTHDELLQLPNGIYAKLVARQMARKQNLIEDEAVGQAVQQSASISAKDLKAKQEKLKEQKNKVDDFDALFDDIAEETQRQQAQELIQKANQNGTTQTTSQSQSQSQSQSSTATTNQLSNGLVSRSSTSNHED